MPPYDGKLGGAEFDKYAFVDEFGNANLDTTVPHVSHYYIVSAVVVDGPTLSEVRAAADEIRRRHFQAGEMKSAGVGGNDDRRLRVLRDIAELPITFFALAVDKDAIRGDGGLIYKDPFVKFLQGQVYRRLYAAISSLAVVSDEQGDQPFMQSFQKYVERRHVRGLFNRQYFEFASSQQEPMLQVADMVSGTLARHFDREKASERSPEFLEALRPITADIAEWPVEFRPQDRVCASSLDDDAVAVVALEQAERFIAENRDAAADDVHAQLCAVQYLLYFLRFVDRAGYVATKSLQEVLREHHGLHVSEHRLRSSIVAPLRDAGLLIASSQGGYKIPTSVAELLDFVDHALNIVEPLLSRVGGARERVLLATAGKTDILAGDRYERLRAMLGSAVGRSAAAATNCSDGKGPDRHG